MTEGTLRGGRLFVEIRERVLRGGNPLLIAFINDEEMSGMRMSFSKEVHRMDKMEHSQRLGSIECCRGSTTDH